MLLPRLPFAGGERKTVQNAFGGYNHNLRAGEGEIYDMEGLTGRHFPAMSTRPKRRLLTPPNAPLAAPNGLYGREKLYWVDGTGFYCDGELKGTVENSFKRFASLGRHIVILPDKKFYDTETGQLGNIEASWTGGATFRDGALYGSPAEKNTIYAAGADWGAFFRAGDGVAISGCSTLTGNNKTAVIREIAGDELHFYERTFTNGSEPNVTIKRAMPDLDFICENENRLWGCKGKTIYASKLGDIFNWNVFDGLSTDSYAAATGSAGDFTGCVSFLGYPVFFKEGNIYKVYGSIPSNFEVMGSATLGVDEGAGGSLAVAGETLYYMSRGVLCAYSGGRPTSVGAAFGEERYSAAVAGSDGLNYYVSMKDARDEWHMFVYDTARGLWHREGSKRAMAFASVGGSLYMLDSDGRIWVVSGPPPAGAEAEQDVHWFAEFGDMAEAEMNRKKLLKAQVRAELDDGASLTVKIKYDGEEQWTCLATVYSGEKRSRLIPVRPNRHDHFRLRLEGQGGCRIYSIAREYRIVGEK